MECNYPQNYWVNEYTCSVGSLPPFINPLASTLRSRESKILQVAFRNWENRINKNYFKIWKHTFPRTLKSGESLALQKLIDFWLQTQLCRSWTLKTLSSAYSYVGVKSTVTPYEPNKTFRLSRDGFMLQKRALNIYQENKERSLGRDLNSKACGYLRNCKGRVNTSSHPYLRTIVRAWSHTPIVSR